LGGVAILARPQHPGDHLERQASEAAARKLGLVYPTSRTSLPARELGELDQVLRAIGQESCDSMLIFPDSAM